MRFEALFYRTEGHHPFELGPLTLEGPDDRPWLLVGPAGSGKSTLLRLLGGVLKPRSGCMRGLDPAREGAYLPQLPERALAGRNLAEDLCGEVRPVAEMRVQLREALAAVGLEGTALSRKSRHMSTGERRRLCLALLHLSSAPCWAIDEPDAGLDVLGREQLRVWLRDRRDRRMWIATHRPEVYDPMDPWTLVLEGGKVRNSGPLREVSALPEVRDLLSGVQAAPLHAVPTRHPLSS